MEISLKLEDWTEARFLDYVVDRVVNKLDESRGESLDDMVRVRIAAALDERIKAITEEHLRKIVDEIVADGWATTNSYGEPTGKRVSARERVAEHLVGRAGSYGSETNAQKMFKEVLDEALRKDLGKEIESAKKSFRAQVDEVLQAKLAESLRSALGLK